MQILTGWGGMAPQPLCCSRVSCTIHIVMHPKLCKFSRVLEDSAGCLWYVFICTRMYFFFAPQSFHFLELIPESETPVFCILEYQRSHNPGAKWNWLNSPGHQVKARVWCTRLDKSVMKATTTSVYRLVPWRFIIPSSQQPSIEIADIQKLHT